jgi:Domain of unknown function (DUF4410)
MKRESNGHHLFQELSVRTGAFLLFRFRSCSRILNSSVTRPPGGPMFTRSPLANRFTLGLVCAVALSLTLQVSAGGQSQQGSQPQEVPIFVSDFELSVVPVNPSTPAAPPNTPKKASNERPTLYQDSDTPSEQARLLVSFFSKTLLQSLQNSKFTSAKQPGARPSSGVLIRGVFAEPDAMNRIRRALLGNDAPGGKFLLYIGIFNLSRPDAPLYDLVSAQTPDPRYGPLITLNNYVPLAKFELSRDPAEEDVRKICAQIVANLAALLANNPAAFSQ